VNAPWLVFHKQTKPTTILYGMSLALSKDVGSQTVELGCPTASRDTRLTAINLKRAAFAQFASKLGIVSALLVE
jgi:hypothetical protein